jgi:hypothetical protein
VDWDEEPVREVSSPEEELIETLEMEGEEEHSESVE